MADPDETLKLPDNATILAMLGLPPGWVVKHPPQTGDVHRWIVSKPATLGAVPGVEDSITTMVACTGLEMAAFASPIEAISQATFRVRADLERAGVQLVERAKLPPLPYSACDLCGILVATSWSRWAQDAPCHTFRCVCGGCHAKVREVGERALAAIQRLGLGAALELVRRLETYDPAPPRDQAAGVPRPDMRAAFTVRLEAVEDVAAKLGERDWSTASIAEREAFALRLVKVIGNGPIVLTAGTDPGQDVMRALGQVAARLGCEADAPTMLRHIERVVRDGQRKDKTIGELMNRLAEAQGHPVIDLDGPARAPSPSETKAAQPPDAIADLDKTLRGSPTTPELFRAGDGSEGEMLGVADFIPKAATSACKAVLSIPGGPFGDFVGPCILDEGHAETRHRDSAGNLYGNEIVAQRVMWQRWKVAGNEIVAQRVMWQRWKVARNGETRGAYVPATAPTTHAGLVLPLSWPTKGGPGPVDNWVLVEAMGPPFTGPKPRERRGVDYPCEDCGATQGSRLDNGWWRCSKCGYPGQ